jgi:putative Holliday junction resolvase
VNENAPVKAPKTRIVGIDFGMARIGVAISDERKIIATPLCTVRTERRTEDTIEKILEEIQKHVVANKYVIEAFVIGMPLMMSGKKGHVADEVTHFVSLFQKQVSVPVVSWDERLTTVQAERSLLESNLTRKRRSAVVDTVAATIILQNYLDSKSSRD